MWLVGVVSGRQVKQWEWVESMGVVSRRWVWVESMSVASGCGCKEVYRFPNITYPYILLLLCSFFATASLLLYSLKKIFFQSFKT